MAKKRTPPTKRTTKAKPKPKAKVKPKAKPKVKTTRPKKAISVTPPKPITTPTRKKPRNMANFVRVSTRSKQATFVEMGQRVQKGELKWSRYVLEDGVGYHYYLILKK